MARGPKVLSELPSPSQTAEHGAAEHGSAQGSASGGRGACDGGKALDGSSNLVRRGEESMTHVSLLFAVKKVKTYGILKCEEKPENQVHMSCCN